jgi:hypothetical protein
VFECPGSSEDGVDRVNEEIIILEIPENEDIENDSEYEQEFFAV